MKYTGSFVSFISTTGFYDRIERIKSVLRIEQRAQTHKHIAHSNSKGVRSFFPFASFAAAIIRFGIGFGRMCAERMRHITLLREISRKRERESQKR